MLNGVSLTSATCARSCRLLLLLAGFGNFDGLSQDANAPCLSRDVFRFCDALDAFGQIRIPISEGDGDGAVLRFPRRLRLGQLRLLGISLTLLTPRTRSRPPVLLRLVQLTVLLGVVLERGHGMVMLEAQRVTSP
jgi:hypothetical protein